MKPGADNYLTIKAKFDEMWNECEIPLEKRGMVMTDNASENAK